jgi:hypothetical protein
MLIRTLCEIRVKYLSTYLGRQTGYEATNNVEIRGPETMALIQQLSHPSLVEEVQ